jgi:hypothetical protein
LYFRDFLSLSISKVGQALAVLPRLNLIDFQYCNLIIPTEEEQYKMIVHNVTGLNLMWTDFSTEAIRQLLLLIPNLNRVVLGANHNRKPLANDTALKLLTESCHHIKDISISLQQVKETSICHVIETYGSQLEQLSIRCEGNDTIKTISHYTKKLQHLVIRCNNSGYHNVLNILKQCQSLNHLEMISWPLQDVPTIVLDQLRYKRQYHHTTTTTTQRSSSSITAPHSSYIEGIKRTVALDRQDLQEIRRLC